MNLKPILLAAGLASASALSATAQVGGGYVGNGLAGEYFSNANLSGSPAFIRRELRLDFDWGTVLPVGGSIDPRYQAVTTDNFSARFTGRIIADFSETYTFKLTADDGARLFIRPEGGSSWTTLIDQWTAPGTFTATSSLVRGARYEVKVEYRELTGTAALRLLWSSASTPEEVIEPTMNQGFNVNFFSQGYADLTKSARNRWEINGNGVVTMDANGWPQNDASLVLQESLNQGLDVDPLTEGVSHFSFKGRATVSVQGNAKAADGSNNLAYSYNAGTNTTTGTLRITPNGWNAAYLRLADTDRDGQLPARRNGVTDLRLMRPSTPGGSTPYPAGTIFNDHARAAGAKFTALRVNLNNANAERSWSDRTRPTFFNQSDGKTTKNTYVYSGGVDPNPVDVSNGPSWEYGVMLCNETGADLYINVPVMATGWSPGDTSSYVYKLAQLIRYGSDGVNPYSAPTANPVYPPLNSNLRVYVELSNEVWNSFGSAFRQYFDVNEMMKVDARTALGTPTASDLVDPLARPTDFAILNFDNLSTAKDGNGNFTSGDTWRKRKIILRAIQVSDIFRSVWGDSNMGPRVRPLYEWQYADNNATASAPLKFIDDYFNNGDGGNHVATPRPVNHYFWGGGGAAYYGAVNGYGVTEQLVNSSFDTPVLTSGYSAAPAGANWTFSGTAGIARDAGAGDDIPPGWAGSAQCGYIAGTGSMSMQVTIPATQMSNVYAFVFKSVQRVKNGTSTPDTQQLKLFVNGVSMNWKSFNQSGGYTPVAYTASNPWNSYVVFWSPSTPYYSSNTFTAAPGETVTLRIEGAGAADQAAFLEDVRLASEDRMFADGFPGGGEALGQPIGSGFAGGLNTQASWAFAYGLKYVTYEGGWSLGGDTGGTPLQNTGKFHSAEAAVANTKAIDMFHQAGGYLDTYGTYALWPNWSEALAEEGLLDVSQYPLIYSQDERMDNLRAEPANGTVIPNNLEMGNASLRSGGTGNVTGRNWLSWNAISTSSSDYTITINTGSGGTAQLWIDGVPLGASFTTGSAVTRTARLDKGVHGLRLQGISGSFVHQGISFSIPGAPAAPVITTITDGSGTKTIEWSAVAGAAGYIVRWGVDKGVYLSSADVTTGTSKILTDLIHDQTYYFVVSAYNAVGLSLPSAEVGSTALVDGLTGHLARWEFSGATGNEAAVSPSSSTSRLITTTLARGPGLKLSTYGETYTSDGFAYMQSGTPGSITAAEALARGDYGQFTVTPKSGTTVSINSLLYAPYWQSSPPALATVGIAYSIDGGAYTIATVSGTPGAGSGSPLTATLSGIPALQNLTVPVTFRLLQSNLGQYSFAGIGRHAGDDIVLMGSVNSSGAAVAAPTGLVATAGSSSQITLTWTDNSSNETGFKIERSPDGSAAWTQIAAPAANATTYSDTGLSTVITYFYRVRATSGVGDSSYTNTASAITSKLDQTITFGAIATKTIGDAPFALGATASSGLAISYASSNTAVATVSGNTVTVVGVGTTTISASQSGNGVYNPAPNVSQSLTVLNGGQTGQLARWEFAGATGNEAAAPPTASSSQLTVTSLIRGAGMKLSGYSLTYTADSFAYEQSGFPGSTTAAGALTRGDYTQFTVTPNAGSTVSISSLLYTPYWQNSVPAVSAVGIAYSINGGAYTIVTVSGTPGTINGSPLTATLSGVTALQNLAVPVTFRLLQPAIGEYTFAGIGRSSGDDIVLTGSVNTPVPPAAPTGLTATANSASQITLNWTDHASNETGFKVERSPNGSTAWTQIAAPAANVTSYADTGRSAVTPYFYRVRASSSAGDSAYTATASATTFKLDQTITFSALTAKTYGDAAFALGATASSGLTISYASSNTSVATVSGNTVTIVGAGSATITASQPGNASYNAAASIARTLTVNNGNLSGGGLTGSGLGGATGYSATLADGTWEINGAGNGLNGTSDGAWFESQPATGSFQVSARLRSLVSAGSDPLAGLLIRAGAVADAPAAAIAISPGGEIITAYRAQGGVWTELVNSADSVIPPNAWLTLQRRGVEILAYLSTDGVNETLVASLPLASDLGTVQAGLFTTSGSSGVSSRAIVSEYAKITSAAGVLRQYWTGISGTAISDLTGLAGFPNAPTGSTQQATLESVSWINPAITSNWADNYGQRVRGWIVAPASGTYTFWSSGDDSNELWLGTGANPASKSLVASVSGWTSYHEWNKYTNQKSAAITLEAGKMYYLEILHKEGGGGDSLSVGWLMPGETGTVPSGIVPASVLTPWEP